MRTTEADDAERDADGNPACHRIPGSWWLAGLGASAALCTAVLSPLFGMPLYQPLVALLVAMLVAVLAVRALGQTDLNPVSGVGKLSQVRQETPPRALPRSRH